MAFDTVRLKGIFLKEVRSIKKEIVPITPKNGVEKSHNRLFFNQGFPIGRVFAREDISITGIMRAPIATVNFVFFFVCGSFLSNPM